jgi:uncharacterized protein (TIGR02266 family)
MRAPSPAPTPQSSREAEFAQAEAEQARDEASLADQLSRAAVEAEALARRLSTLRAELSRLPAEQAGEEGLRQLAARLESVSTSTGSAENQRERGLARRQQALEERQQALRESQDVLKALERLNSQTQQELAESEATLKRSVEAAERARREREAAARAQQRQAPRAAPPGLPSQKSRPAPAGATAVKARRPSRVRMQASIDLRSDSNFFTGFSSDIHSGGVFVATVESVPRGTTVDLDFTLPGGRPLQVSGVVRWTREVNDKTPELMPGLGVQFTSLPPEVASAISTFVSQREPLFFPE